MRKWLICLIIFAAILAACAPAQTSTPTSEAQTDDVTEEAGETPTEAADEATDEATEMAEPTEDAGDATEEPVDEATDEATEEAIALDATFTSSDGSVTFMYPADWFVTDETGQIMLGNSEQALQAAEGMPAPGEFRSVILVAPAASFDVTLTEDATPLEVIEALEASMTGTVPVSDTVGVEATEEAADESEATEEAAEEADDSTLPDTFEFEDAEEVTIGMHDAARMVGTRGEAEVIVWIIKLDDDLFAAIIAASAADEMADFEAVVTAVAETIQYTPPM